MPILNIRDLPVEVHTRLKRRAASAHRSMEAEARQILIEACLSEAEPTAALPDWIDELYGGSKPVAVVDKLIAERRREAERE
jgi:plasmid stability protein